jgi:predicted N-formylglutamate amidohydrolase
MDIEPNSISGNRYAAAAEIVNPDGGSDYLLVCDHASNTIPSEYGTLGLTRAQLQDHIAWDIGAADVTRHLSKRLDAPAVLSKFSRLLIDPNRMPDDPTLIVTVSDNVAVPSNMALSPDDARWRQAVFYDAYQAAVGDLIEKYLEVGRIPALVSIHSFTPVMQDFARPWQIGLLWDADPRLKDRLFEELSSDPALVIGDNEPYSGKGPAGTMEYHGMRKGLPHILIEIRQDLIDTPEGAARWGDVIGAALERVLRDRSFLAIKDYR